MRRPPELLTWLPAVIDDVVVACHPQRVIVFGSMVRGDDGPDSDIDLLVELDAAPREQRLGLMAEIRAAITAPVAVDVLVTDPAELAERGGALGALGCLEAREGRFELARALVSEDVQLSRSLGDNYLLISAVGVQSHVELMAGCDDAAAEHLVEALRLTAAIDNHEAAQGLVLAAELLRRRGDEAGAAHAYRLARRTWPHDDDWFRLLGRFVTGDASRLEALPTSRAAVPPTMRQRVEWAADRIGNRR